METINVQYKGYLLTTDKSLMQAEAIHKWLSEESYWAKGISFETVKGAFESSYCLGVIKDGKQIGYSRLVTDYHIIAWLGDVYIEKEHRGLGLSKKMIEILFEQGWTRKLKKVFLGTLDAHGLYAQYGFEPIAEPQRWMEIMPKNVYLNSQTQ